MIGLNLTQKECNRLSKFLGKDFNMVKILLVPFKKKFTIPLLPFFVPASPPPPSLLIAHLLDLSHNYIKYKVTFALNLKRKGNREAKQLLFIGNIHKYIQTSFQTINLKNLPS